MRSIALAGIESIRVGVPGCLSEPDMRSRCMLVAVRKTGNNVPCQTSVIQSVFHLGAVYIWDGSRRVGNSCRRWLKLFTGFGRGRGQAQGLPLPFANWRAKGRHKACPYLSLFGGQRAGTRPAPTFRYLEGKGQAQGLPLPFAIWRAKGRHKACPYLSLFGGQRAGTRPGPTVG